MNQVLLVCLIELPLIVCVMVSMWPDKVKRKPYIPTSIIAGMLEGAKK